MPHHVWDDNTLLNFARRLPITAQQMVALPAVSMHKVGKFGNNVLELCREYTGKGLVPLPLAVATKD